MRTQIIRLSQVLCILNAAIWIVLSILSLNHPTENLTMPQILNSIIVILMLGNAGAFLIVGFGLGKSNRLYYLLALMLVIINVATSLTDQMGCLDWSVFGLNIILLGLLVTSKRVFL